MTLQKNKVVRLYEKFSLLIPPKLKFYTDGLPGQRVLFISDLKETFIVSFEEGMKPMDMRPDTGKSVPAVSYQCCKDGKYIHFKRNTSGNTSNGYFHMELEDGDGKQHCLAGQIVVTANYQWSDGIEPVLMELLTGIRLIPMKGGG